MKKTALSFCMALCAVLSYAQPPCPESRQHPGPAPEEVIKMQTRDMVYWLELEGEVKDKFVNEYTAFRKEIDEVAKKAMPPGMNKDAGEEEIEKAIQQNFEVGEQILQIRKKYYARFKTFLKPSQIQMMYHIENETGRRMMRGGHGGHGGPCRPDGPESRGPRPE